MKKKAIIFRVPKPDAFARFALVTFTKREAVEKAFGALVAKQIFEGKR